MILLWRSGFIIALIVVSGLTLAPQQSLPPVHLWDKLEHALAFAGLMLLADNGWRVIGTLPITAGLLGYGLLIEVLQLWVPGRQFSWLDLAADATGIACYLAAAFAVKHLAGRHRAMGQNPEY